jgi:hypothetical protein
VIKPRAHRTRSSPQSTAAAAPKKKFNCTPIYADAITLDRNSQIRFHKGMAIHVVKKSRFDRIFALCFGAIITAISWLLISQWSPVRTSSEALVYFVSYVQIFAAFAAMTLSGNPHLGAVGEVIYWMLVLVQWVIVGFGVSFLFRLRWHHVA